MDFDPNSPFAPPKKIQEALAARESEALIQDEETGLTVDTRTGEVVAEPESAAQHEEVVAELEALDHLHEEADEVHESLAGPWAIRRGFGLPLSAEQQAEVDAWEEAQANPPEPEVTREFELAAIVRRFMIEGGDEVSALAALAELETLAAMAQLSDPTANGVGRVHSDPRAGVEKLAALKVFPRTGTQRGMVLEAIAASGDRGMTHDEIEQIKDVSPRAHRTRRKELEIGGWVKDSGRRRDTATKTAAIVWVLTDAARAKLDG